MLPGRDDLPLQSSTEVNLLAPEFGIQILAHPVCKMRIVQTPKPLALLNKRHFEEKKRRVCSMFKKFSTYI
jgi:hypothetical protein